MTLPFIIALRHPDGSFLHARVLDRYRCCVIASDIAAAGDILSRPDHFTWRDAGAEDETESFATNLSPYELLGSDHPSIEDDHELHRFRFRRSWRRRRRWLGKNAA